VPINKPRERSTKIVGKKVITERRNILAGPIKQGNSNTPGILFSYFSEDAEKLREMAKSVRKNLPTRPAEEKKSNPFPFKPAALKKNDLFQPLPNEDEEKVKSLLAQTIEEKKSGRRPYEPKVVAGAAKHIGPFKPSSLIRKVHVAYIGSSWFIP
jgi:hypothetical protein